MPDTVSTPKGISSSSADDTGSAVADGAGGTKRNSSSQPPAFDEKAIQRSFMVLAGLGTILIAYFGIKFAW